MTFFKQCRLFFNTLFAQARNINLPTILTLSRILLTPIIVMAMRNHQWLLAFFIFMIAALTDVLDGLLARYYNENTFLGALLDPLADKILVLSCLTTLAIEQSPFFIVPWWFVVLIFTKEVMLLGGAALIFYQKGYIEIKPTALGKCAMFAQVIFIIWIFLCYFFALHPFKTYRLVVYLLTVLIVAAFIDYVRLGFNFLVKKKEKD